MMTRTLDRRARKGAVLVESAIVYAVFLMLLLGGLSVGLGIFRHQEIAHLARESARWSSLQDVSMRTPAQIMTNVIRPNAVGVDPDDLTVTTTPAQTDMATVTITYPWIPEVYLAPVTLRSTARARIAY
ncbi:TadE/TadG family type IV pilus assembly protein [Paludisphaera mucosa]|uniref:TadE/TadG family type IV pilus assembly protein n=1 Tax=Paludisphaera mucosa TaxID=3030827 RepID=A0ABT6FB19_9BACT|nr:TadE/TadG family type IV pilus assembly protein [Paludisphaera mucosa]MDG3004754.1 TadE/TadG family type IV pilus assembly protein [Paludisphaera mucosa]